MPPILLIHGLIGSLSAPAILRAFGEAEVLAPDLLGYGTAHAAAPVDWTLADQADHLAGWLDRAGIAEPVHLVGHSVGGAVAVLFARRYPGRTASLTSVEGNFTLGDAFWSQQIARQPLAEVGATLAGFRADVTGWLAGAGVEPTPATLEIATDWLARQPAATLRNQAQAVVAATGQPEYLADVRYLLDSGLRLNLIAGERSRAEWHVPNWVMAAAARDCDLPGCGHLLMLEDPNGFADAVLAGLSD